MNDRSNDTRLLKATDVRKIAPVSEMTLWRWIKAGVFPAPIKITGRNYWRYDEVQQWIDQKSRARTAA